jgi:hypothetical protein
LLLLRLLNGQPFADWLHIGFRSPSGLCGHDTQLMPSTLDSKIKLPSRVPASPLVNLPNSANGPHVIRGLSCMRFRAFHCDGSVPPLFISPAGCHVSIEKSHLQSAGAGHRNSRRSNLRNLLSHPSLAPYFQKILTVF